jgi:hypothetical protein
MADADPRFNATKFRDAIHFAMKMGLPNASTEQIAFRWLERRTYDKQDTGGNPYDWTDTPVTDTVVADVYLQAAVEFQFVRSGVENNPVGQFESPNLVVTLLDTEYPYLFSNGKRADQIVIDEAVYQINFIAPPIGLFDVTVYQVYASGLDEA